MSIDNQKEEAPDVNSLSYEELLNSDDPELAEIARQQLGLSDGEESKSADEDDATQSVEQPAEKQEQAEQVPAQEQEQEQKQEFVHGVYDKSGKNILPYEELATTRRKASDLQAQLEKSNAEAEKLRRQVELATKKGIDLPTLPEDEKLTDEMLQEMEEISPELGIMARKLRFMVDKAETQSQQLADANKEVDKLESNDDSVAGYARSDIQTAIANNPAISGVMKDPKLSQLAISIEKTLSDDPQYTSLEARYHEVVKRLGGATGRNIFAEYGMQGSAPKATIPKTPHSMSDLASSAPTSGRTEQEVLSELSDSELQKRMDSMSIEQIEELMG